MGIGARSRARRTNTHHRYLRTTSKCKDVATASVHNTMLRTASIVQSCNDEFNFMGRLCGLS